MSENNKNAKIISFPYIGKYTPFFKEFFENLGCQVILPPKITDKTIKIGTKYSSEMMCFPYKVTLGNFIEVLQVHPEIDYLTMYDSQGQCRFRHYYILQEQTLKKLGFKAQMAVLNYKNIFKLPQTLNPELNKIQIIKEYWRAFKKLKELSKRNLLKENMPNILIIGEIYTCVEPSINYGLEERLKKYGVNCINSVDLFSFVTESFNKIFGFGLRKRYLRKAKKYLNGPLGGHGIENIASLLEYIDKGIDGAIWLRPLTCMPETTVDPIIKHLCHEKDIPLLIFDIDESNFALNIETRLETFIEQVKLDYESPT
jgi:predicted nucleotide-binding protein (sugar kinase/HSP70/actin superfamily)